jgi:hypothetical protein
MISRPSGPARHRGAPPVVQVIASSERITACSTDCLRCSKMPRRRSLRQQTC